MKYLIDFLLIGLLSVSSLINEVDAAENNFVHCGKHFHRNMEPSIPAIRGSEGQLAYLCYDEFAVLYLLNGRVPMYSAQVLNKDEVEKGYEVGRSSKEAFHEELRLPSFSRSTVEGYKQLNRLTGNMFYDRGHLTPSADMPTVKSEYESFSLANIVPQAPSMNRGPWAEVEKATRRYVKRASSDVYIVTGVLFTRDAKVINGIYVPSHLWKAVFDPVVNKGWVHIMPNTDKAVISKPMGLRSFKSLYGIDVFNNADGMTE